MNEKKKLHAEVDRIEDEGFAVLLILSGDDYLAEVPVPVEDLPTGTQEGHHLKISFTRDEESERNMDARIEALRED